MAEQTVVRDRHGAHSRNGADLVRQVFVELQYIGSLITGLKRVQIEKKQVVTVEAKLDLGQFLETMYEETRDNQQHQ